MFKFIKSYLQDKRTKKKLTSIFHLLYSERKYETEEIIQALKPKDEIETLELLIIIEVAGRLKHPPEEKDILEIYENQVNALKSFVASNELRQITMELLKAKANLSMAKFNLYMDLLCREAYNYNKNSPGGIEYAELLIKRRPLTLSEKNLIDIKYREIEKDATSVKRFNANKAFEKGKQSFINKQYEDALVSFDSALENGFEDSFKDYVGNLYDMRGACLQKLDYHYDAIMDFDKAILLYPKDCNKYFSRSFSKSAILDYKGAVSDIKKAIEISKEDNELNRAYCDEAEKMGYGSAAGMFYMHLIRYEMELESEKEYKEKIESASSTEHKAFWQNMIDEQREKRLSQIKRRRN